MLTSKQRAYIRSLAVKEDTILMPESSPMTSREAAEELARQTSSDVVQVIGSRFVLYRKKKKDPKIVLPR